MSAQSAKEFRERAAKRRKTKDVELLDLGSVRLRALSAGDGQQFQADVRQAEKDGRPIENLTFSLIARSWIGEDGELWFPEEEGIAVARDLDPEAFKELTMEVFKLNGLNAKAVEDAVKNSEASRPDSTLTGSPETSDTPTST